MFARNSALVIGTFVVGAVVVTAGARLMFIGYEGAPDLAGLSAQQVAPNQLRTGQTRLPSRRYDSVVLGNAQRENSTLDFRLPTRGGCPRT